MLVSTSTERDLSQSGSLLTFPCLLISSPKPQEMGKSYNREQKREGSGATEDGCATTKNNRIPSCKAIKRQERKLKCIKEKKGTF